MEELSNFKDILPEADASPYLYALVVITAMILAFSYFVIKVKNNKPSKD